MSEAYRIKKFHHVTVAKHDRLRDEKLVPLLDKLADKHIMNEDFDDLLSSTEAMSLHIEDFDNLEDWLGVIQNMLEGDWLIYYKNSEHPVYLMKFKRYSYQPHKHLYVKHFGELSHVFEVKQSDLPEEVLTPLLAANHLETLPLSVSNMLDKYEVLALAMEQEATRQKQNEEESKPRTKVKRGRPSKHGEVIVTRAAYKNLDGIITSEN